MSHNYYILVTNYFVLSIVNFDLYEMLPCSLCCSGRKDHTCMFLFWVEQFSTGFGLVCDPFSLRDTVPLLAEFLLYIHTCMCTYMHTHGPTPVPPVCYDIFNKVIHFKRQNNMSRLPNVGIMGIHNEYVICLCVCVCVCVCLYMCRYVCLCF